jgi:hypothetical protein
MSDSEHKTGVEKFVINDGYGDLLRNKPWLDPAAAAKAGSLMGIRPIIFWKSKDPRDQGLLTIDNFKRQKPSVPAKSLQWLALRLKKSTRTVKRYCELGLVPGAWRTNGETGHWRVPHGNKTVIAVRRRIKQFARDHARAWENKRRKSLDRLESLARVAYQLATSADDLFPGEETGKDGLSPLVKRAAQMKEREAELMVAARWLAMKQLPMTATALAKEMKISRATLYRLFSRELIARVLAEGFKVE